MIDLDRGFDAERLDSLRRDFDAELDRLLARVRLPRLPAWFERRPSDRPLETTIQSWLTPDGARGMVLQETLGMQTLNFDWIFKRTGIEDEIEMLHMDIRNVDHHVLFVVECYRRWLIDREGEESVDAFIERYARAEG